MSNVNERKELTLITGASGFIGGQIAHLLYQKGYRLRLLLRKSSPTHHLKGIDYEPVYGDLRDKASLKKACQGVNVIYHVAALYAFWRRRKQDFFDSNVSGTQNICEVALASNVSRFVYTSSTAAVGISDSPTKPLTEDAPWNREWTDDPYSLSKYEAEQVVLECVQKGLPAVILNPTGPIGPGDVHPTPTGKLLCDFAKGRVPFYLEAHFSLADVRDVAMGHYLAEKKGEIGRRYILSAENLTGLDYLTRVAKALNKKPPSIKIPTPLIKAFAKVSQTLADCGIGPAPLVTTSYAQLLPYYFWFNTERSQKELGLTYRPIEEGIKDALDWFRTQKMI